MRAEVAPRTVAIYFPIKQDIAMARFSQSVGELSRALRDMEPGESGTAIMARWLRARGPEAEQDTRELSARMFAANPELDALRTARMAAVIAQGADIIARDTGAAPGDRGPRIAAVAAAAIMIELTDIPPGPDREQAITTAMRFFDAGLEALRSANPSTGAS
jgi:AcrR family transcriptional regulator